MPLLPVSVEITYGLERILMSLEVRKNKPRKVPNHSLILAELRGLLL